MKRANFFFALPFAVAGYLVLANPSAASTLAYTLENVEDGQGDTFTGTFNFDTVADIVTSFNIVAAGPNTGGETFDTLLISSATEQEFGFVPLPNCCSILDLSFSTDLATNPIGLLDPLITASSIYGTVFAFEDNVSGGAVVTPLPGALPLLATSLGVLGFLTRRGRRKTTSRTV